MRSDLLKKGPSRAPARVMLEGAGYTDAPLEKPLIGVANAWTDVTGAPEEHAAGGQGHG
ncbi:MAG: hypothetical protein ABSC94_19750 [Polyangiaceae bacterium]|jgi:dihydroxy-acid dehydratase